jgi:hypothetical protein
MDAPGGNIPFTPDRYRMILSHGAHQDDLVRHSANWHEEGGTPLRPEDVILAAFVQLRRIAVSDNARHSAYRNPDFFRDRPKQPMYSIYTRASPVQPTQTSIKRYCCVIVTAS